jgi:hypothetical protein
MQVTGAERRRRKLESDAQSFKETARKKIRAIAVANARIFLPQKDEEWYGRSRA